MNLPEDFLRNMQQLLPAGEFDDFVKALTEGEQPVSIRVNPKKTSSLYSPFGSCSSNSPLPSPLASPFEKSTPVPWCEEGFYLNDRPQFTLDPLFHAGCYYVQEASSMFITHIIRWWIKQFPLSPLPSPLSVLDLCAAPGGKSTAALSVLPEGSKMISNEIDRRRARILAENITKWGYPNVTVTSNAPRDFRFMRHAFDLIITDVPCSGEGMFRKDEGAIADWSLKKVADCAALQHEILDDIWDCLKPGGLLIYSTCTFNTLEDEDMVAYICDELGGEALEVPTEKEWNIHPPLKGNYPCYRFMPHFTKGEGLFMAAIQKNCRDEVLNYENNKVIKSKNNKAFSHSSSLYILQSGIEKGTMKGKDFIPSHALAMSTSTSMSTSMSMSMSTSMSTSMSMSMSTSMSTSTSTSMSMSTSTSDYPRCEVSLQQAQDYLRRMTITLPQETPKGYVIITYNGHPLGFVKNLGNRCNNLYPQEWRIRNL